MLLKLLVVFAMAGGASAVAHYDWGWYAGPANPPASTPCLQPGEEGFPSARSQAASCATPEGGLFMFGGVGFGCSGAEGLLSDLWLRSAEGAWTFVAGSLDANSGGTPSAPLPRFDASCLVDADNTLWLYGGATEDETFGDVWTFNPEDGFEVVVLSNCSTGVCRSGAAIFEDPTPGSDTLGIFGGLDDDAEPTNSLYWLNRTSMSFRFVRDGEPTDPAWPPPRSAFAWSISPKQASQLLIYGGASGTGLLGDLWALDTEQLLAQQLSGTTQAPSWTDHPTPGARARSALFVDQEDQVYLVGGMWKDDLEGVSEFMNDVWVYKSPTWTWVTGEGKFNPMGKRGALGESAPGLAPEGRSSFGAAFANATGMHTYCVFGGSRVVGDGDNGAIAGDEWCFQEIADTQTLVPTTAVPGSPTATPTSASPTSAAPTWAPTPEATTAPPTNVAAIVIPLLILFILIAAGVTYYVWKRRKRAMGEETSLLSRGQLLNL